ncbi:tape measure protein [Acinetobacter baumannii]|uniref:tape measure protein n=1 Tax=Acinetobacter baumannii TaxID=470 RepID=UPI0004D8C70F|nr:tape measure protein [Acinetobacter baumannii]EHZ6835481.1 tape measure protein [Acinetobacter baumannii]EIT1517937.1 tape measure protein [Acinetobacter baumannii]EIT1736243.1 tape measure protein [Acinetobacter baumannii]EIT1748953.1 tape measure protein [Acinetobacter baumannii]EJG9768831.1 tape measure protein [Acinetobacter baumannii]
MAQESRLVIVIDAKNAERNARNLGNELDSIERKGDFATKSMDALSVATRQLAGYMAGLVTVSAAISKMDTYTGLQNRLKLVTNNQVELNKATEDTFRIAQKTYSAWDSVLQVYQRFSDNAKTLNLTMDDTARLTETVSKAVAISGASAAAADAALVQFGQALASGTLRGEELNSVMEQTPALAKAIAQGMGITVGELRTVAAEGKITSQEIVKALKNVQADVDALFAKTDITISQSLTLLNNEITKFVGESGKGSGAAEVLSGSIKTLAGNLDVLTSAMMVGGAYWLGTYIPAIYASGVAVAAKTKELAAQTFAQYTAIQADRAAAAQQVLSTQAVVANTQATLAAIAAEKALEVQRLKSQITEKGRTATITRMAELKKIEAQVTRELAVAEEALAVAQSRSAAAGAATVGIGSRLLGLLGGPVGIGITVASLAAGYLLMRDNTNEANKKLEEQTAVAKKAKEELLALKGLEKDSAINDMTASFERQNQALAESSSKINIQLNAIAQLYKGNKEIVQVVNDARDGTISMNDAVKRFNELRISKDIYNALKENSSEFEKNAKEAKTTKESLKLFGIEVELSGRKAQTAVAGIDDNSKALIGNESAAQKATKAQKGYFDSLRAEVLKSNEELALLNLGYSEETVKKILELQKAKQAVAPPGTTAIVTKEEMDQIAKAQKALDALKEKKDELTAAERKHTSELEKQQKVLSINAKVQANAAKYNFSGIESKYNLPAGTLSAIHMIESRGNARAYNKSTGATGGFQFLEGTAKQYGVKDRYDLAQSAEGAGKYMSYLLKLFKGDLEKAVRAYHAGEGNVQKGKGIGKNNNQYWKDFMGYVAGANGYSAGDISSKDFDKLLQDTTNLAKEQAKIRLQLENDVANEVTKIRNDLAKKLEDVDKANFTPERKAEIKAELQARADNDIAIAEQATKTKLDSFRDFTKSEEQLLKDSFAKRQFEAEHDLEMTKEQRKEAVNLLAQQLQQELGLLKLAQEQRLFQAKLFLLSETEAMQERYRLEREEIAKTVKDEEEKRKRLALSRDQERLEALDRAAKAGQAWGGIQADMNGSGEFYRLDQERSSRLSAATNLLDSQQGVVNLNEQNSIEALNAQFEQQLISQQDYENQKTAIIQTAQDQRNQIAAEYAKNAQDIEDKYQQDRLNTQIAFGGQMMGSLTSMFGSMFGEQSKAYKIMFAADKAYAIAAAGIAIQQNIAAASKAGFPYNLPLIAGAVAQGASIIANIRAIKDQGFADGGYTGSGGKYEPAGIVHKGEVVWSQEDIKRWGGVGLVEKMRKSANPEAFINNHATNNTSVENVFNRSFLSSKAFNDNKSTSNISNLSNSKVLNSNVSNSTVQNAEKELLKEVSIFKDNGFADGGYTGKGKKYEIAGAVHKGEIVWSQDDIKKWGGVDKVEQMRRATSPESFVSNYAQNHSTFESILNRANQSSRIFNQSKEISNIFNQPVHDGQIIYKGNSNVPTSATSDLYHDGKVYFSSNGLVQDRSNLDDVQDFTMGQAARPQAEIMPSIEPSTPTINFKIEVINQVNGATVEAEQLDEQTVRIIVKDELDKQLPRTVPKLVSDQIGNPNSTISRSLTKNTTVRRNR